jgi:hypothetical protein
MVSDRSNFDDPFVDGFMAESGCGCGVAAEPNTRVRGFSTENITWNNG